MLVAAHLSENNPTSRRGLTTGRAYPLGESGRPSRADGIDAIVRYLAVDASARYQRTPQETFCNIYACDFCYLAGVYLPRVWWTPQALQTIAAGTLPAAKYAVTVAELNANSLYGWLLEYGPQFGWRSVADESELQAAVNTGAVGVICARRKVASTPGHIAVVVPERVPQEVAVRSGDQVRLPLQSQAGAKNFCYGCGVGKWWAGAQFGASGFFINAG